MGTGTTGTVGMGDKFLSPRSSSTCIQEIEAFMDMDISMDIHVKSVDMDMDAKFHIHGKHVYTSGLVSTGMCNRLRAGSLNRVPVLLGVKAGMSHMPGGR